MKVALKRWAPVVALCLFAVAARAQTPHVGYTFAIPQGVDPPVVIDLTSLNTPQSFSGADLIDSGLEFHGQLPGTGAGTFRDIVQIQFSLFVGGAPDLQVLAGGPWAPWDISTMPGTTPGFETVTLTAHGPVGQPGGSAPLNDFFATTPGQSVPGPVSSYLVLGADVSGNQSFIDSFRALTFQAQATSQGAVSRSAVPEPGTAGLLVGLFGVVSGICLTRRRRVEFHAED